MEIYNYIQENIFAQYFLCGMLGSFLFDATLYFRRDLGLLAEQKKIKEIRNFNIIYIFFQTLYSGVTGGILGLALDTHWLMALTAGFFSSTFLTFLIKTALVHSSRKAFWITIGKLVFQTIGEPAKKLLIALEAMSYTNNETNRSNTKKSSSTDDQ